MNTIETIREYINKHLDIYDSPDAPPGIRERCSVYKELLFFLDSLENKNKNEHDK